MSFTIKLYSRKDIFKYSRHYSDYKMQEVNVIQVLLKPSSIFYCLTNTIAILKEMLNKKFT